MHTLSILCYETHCILRYLYFSNTLFVIFISKNTKARPIRTVSSKKIKFFFFFKKFHPIQHKNDSKINFFPYFWCTKTRFLHLKISINKY